MAPCRIQNLLQTIDGRERESAQHIQEKKKDFSKNNDNMRNTERGLKNETISTIQMMRMSE